jgi:molybdenum cofactor cytidylyltransferase
MTSQRESLRFGVVILAAGASSRMGRPKLLLPWGGTTVLGSLLHQWHSIGAKQLGVVCSGNDVSLAAEINRPGQPRAEAIVNPQPERGMFSSVRCAASWNGWKTDLTHYVISLGDQPHLRKETLAALLSFAGVHPAAICQPGRAGRGKHPLVLPKTVFKQLQNTTAETLKHFVQACGVPVQRLEIDDVGLDLDIDRPEDYEAALRLAGL